MSSRTDGWARAAAVAAAALAVDQVAKQIAVASVGQGEKVNVFLGLDISHVRNTGVAFGALAGGGSVVVGLVLVAMIVLVVYFTRHARTRFLWLPVGAILGGALGNLADRARDGTVIDFIDPIAWPAFNLADVLIVAGVLGIFYVVEGSRQGDDRTPG